MGITQPNSLEENPKPNLQEILRFLTHLRYDYRDEIPEEIVVDETTPVTHKCQKNWFGAVIGFIEKVKNHLEKYGKNTPDQLQLFMRKFTSDDFHRQQLVVQEDIIEANLVLDLAINIVEEELRD